MPNIAPRGLYGRHLGVWKNPPAIYARVGGVWKKVYFVYAMQNGVWQLIWGSDPVKPTSATAAWLTPHSVKVTIVAPAVNTSTNWIVRRSDGSIVATVPVATLTVTDVTPLLTSTVAGNKTLAAYTVEGSDGTTSSAKVSTGTVTWNLDTATTTAVVTYPSTATVTLNWTPNATYGEPDGWRTWRSDGVWSPTTGVIAASSRSYAWSNQPRGEALNFRVIPFTLNAAGVYVQAGNAANTVANVKALAPASLVLTATTPTPLSNLRLTWASGGGTVTAYEVEHSTNGTTWVAHTDDTSPSDWSTTVAGYMRVRATSAGGVSDWAQKGPVTPINDTTPPANPSITSLWPESSYGRLVIRFKTPTDADFAAYQVRWKVGSGAYTYGAWVNGNPNTAYAVVVGTFSASQNVTVGVGVKDDAGNVNQGYGVAYNLVASPLVVDPSGDKSGTTRGGVWRNDSTRGPTELATGWTSSGHNCGCFLYGTDIWDAWTSDGTTLGRTIVSATIEYYRENEGGLSSAVQPLFWTHNLLTRASGAPAPNAEGVAEASRLGQGVTRVTPVDTGTFTLPAAFITALTDQTARGLCMYRGYQGSGDPDNYYALMGIGAVSNSGVVDGRIKLNHLG